MDAAPLTDLDEIRRMTEATAEAEPGKYGFAPEPPEADQGPGNGHDQEEPIRGEADYSDHHLSDLGLAKRLIRYHGHLIRFCYPWQSWLYFDGCRWTRDDRGEVARRMKDTVSKVYSEAAQSQDGERRKAVAKFALSAESEARRKAATASAQSEPGIPILPDELDRDHFFLNVINGILDQRTGQLIPHGPGHLISKLAPVYYLPEATCTTWLKFLHRVMNGNERLISYLQKAVGYTPTGDTSEQVLHFLYGLGANGKSTFLETVMAGMGDYAKQRPRRFST
jgi:putative DNA primase/helicase